MSIFSLLTLALFFQAGPAASIKGVVVDPAGAPLAQSTIRVLDADTNYLVAEGTSDKDGAFEIGPLKKGKYTITVRTGFAIRILSEVEVRGRVDLGKVELDLGSCEESARVEVKLA
ncbi:MAG TPA: carboxypeptidase-like regulatory domain-containing protein [Bryobacteraceae bacterium]|nr:carboxypeptidase-like regulatory domain-containing protein [Bryobacteraceae bacterium]